MYLILLLIRIPTCLFDFVKCRYTEKCDFQNLFIYVCFQAEIYYGIMYFRFSTNVGRTEDIGLK